MTRLCAFVAAAFAATAGFAAERAPIDLYPRAAAAYAVAIDGEIRWAGALDAPRPPASLAKLATAIVLLEADWDPRATVTVGPRAAAAVGARIGLRRGERLRAQDALVAMIMRSANDACLALVEHRDGDAATFAARVNERLRELGFESTRIVNPCGLDAPGQTSTARELLELARLAARYPSVRAAAVTPKARIETLDGRRIDIVTTNQLIGRVDGITGLKTGYTSQAGTCVIATAQREGVSVEVVLLGAPDRWWTAASLIEEAFHDARRR